MMSETDPTSGRSAAPNPTIRFEITLSSIKINSGRPPGDRFDIADYTRRLADHLKPFLEDVVIGANATKLDHDLEILLPANASERATSAAELLAGRIIDAINRFHERAPDSVARSHNSIW